MNGKRGEGLFLKPERHTQLSLLDSVPLSYVEGEGVSGDIVYVDGNDRDLGGHSLFTGETGHVQYRLFEDNH